MKDPNFVKFSTIKNYIKDTQDMRSSNDAVEYLTQDTSRTTQNILKEAKNYSIQDKRKTIMIEDIKKAKEKVVGKKHLEWQDILEQIKNLSPADIGNLTAAIEDYIREQ